MLDVVDDGGPAVGLYERSGGGWWTGVMLTG